MARNPIAANLLMVLLLAGGAWTAATVQKEVSPRFELDVVEVQVAYPGAAPAEVEQGILLPVEEAIRGVEGIEEITSTAFEGRGRVSIELVAGTDRMRAFQDIDQAVTRIRTFPDDIEEPEVRLVAEQREVMDVGLYGDVDPWTLRQLAEQLRDRLLSDDRITQVELGNVPEYVTHVEIPLDRLREHGLTLGQVADIIERSSEDVPAGAVETHAGEVLLRMQERKQWADELGEIVILTSESGAPLTLADIAEITDGFEEAGFHSQFDQTPSVGVEVYRIGDQSPLEIESAVREILEDFETTLPPAVQLRIDGSSADDFEDRLSLLVENGFLAVVIVLLILTESTRRMFDEHDLYAVAEGVKTNVRGGSFIDVEIVMKPPDERDMTANDVIRLWRDEIGDIEGVDQITLEAERGPGGWAQDISVDLSHSDVDVLEQASKAFVARVEAYESTRDVTDNYDEGKSQLDFRLLPEGRSLGLTPSEVGRQVRDAFFGALALRQLRGTNEVEVRVKLPEHEREDLYHLENFVVRTPGGTEVPLREVVEVRRSEAFTSITRRDGRRVVSVGMDVEPKSAMNRVLEAFERDELPRLRAEFPGITWSFEGTQAEMRESTEALWGGFALAMGVIYSLLAIALRSYTQPLIVMGAIPFGIVGAVVGHLLFGYDLSLVSLMGIIALAGVVVNDSLIMI